VVVLAPNTPKLARLLVAATVAAFVAVLAGVWSNAYFAVEFLGLAACVTRAVHARGTERAAWAVLSVGLLGFVGGDLYWTVVLSHMDAPPYPSPADAAYISLYPAAYIALVLLLRSRAGRISSNLWLDGLICALAVAALGAALVLGVVAQTSGPLATVATGLAYPLGDLALLGFVIGVITVVGFRAGRTWLLLAVGFAVFVIADTIYLRQTAMGIYTEDTILDAAWPAMYVLVAFAAWQPPRRLDARRLQGGGMLVLPAGAALVSLAILLVDHYMRLNELAIWLASAALCACVGRFALTFRANLRMLRASEREATTDALTGLGNRRALLEDLERAAAEAHTGGRHALALFDLDGFKSYNDAFGHPAGDALLERLGHNLTAALGSSGRAYRMGGDEFCVLAPADSRDVDALMRRAAAALTEQGSSFHVGCSHGTVLLDAGNRDAVEALRLADQRMYDAKRSGRPSTAQRVHEVLLSVQGEHDGELRDHVVEVADLAEQVGRRLALTAEQVAHVGSAAALHDIGKVAIPDAILQAPRRLTHEEWGYMRQHTIIGARIIAAAPEMAPVAEIVRSSHEAFDGSGYPDGLAGQDIPLGARIVAVCDSYEAMTTTRAYRAAMTDRQARDELLRCAGSQFDPRVVEAFLAVITARPQPGVLTTA
jgi:two-component system cell cycle response regulator